MIDLRHGDCMEYMRGLPDKAFDLAIVDPPYGIGEDGGKRRTRGSKRTNGEAKGWDSDRPTADYFNEVRRVSENQIIWGGNYFADLLPASRCWIYWRKCMGGDFADGELAWTSFDAVVKEFTMRSETFGRIHPTQKPVALYRWLLKNYAKPGQRIIDTHGGSMSSGVAFAMEGFDAVICEIDKDYFEAGSKRVREAEMLAATQPRLFEPEREEAPQGRMDL